MHFLVWRYPHSGRVMDGRTSSRIYDPQLGRNLLISRCAPCHNLAEILTPRTSPDWKTVIDRMVALAAHRITLDEGRQIWHFVSTEFAPLAAPETISAGLLQRHCLPCHGRSELFAEWRDAAAWREVVVRMNELDPELVPEGMTEALAQHLLQLQEDSAAGPPSP